MHISIYFFLCLSCFTNHLRRLCDRKKGRGICPKKNRNQFQNQYPYIGCVNCINQKVLGESFLQIKVEKIMVGDKHCRDQEKFLLEDTLLCITPEFTNSTAFQLRNWQLHELNHLKRFIELLCLPSQQYCQSSYLPVSTMGSFVLYFYFFLHYVLAIRFLCPTILVNSGRFLVSLKTFKNVK